MGMTITEKILSKACNTNVKPGQIVNARVDRLMTMDFLAPITFKLFEQLGAEKIWDMERVVVVLDHFVPGHTVKDAMQLKLSRDAANKFNIKHFYDIGHHGIAHQVMVENGFVLPGTVALGTDSHTTTYGALGAFSCGVSTSEAAVIMATGKMWFLVPDSVKFHIDGKLPAVISGKDIALKMMGLTHWNGQVAYRAVEVGGSAIPQLSMSDRLTICNMIAEMGAKNGIIAPDETTTQFLKGIAREDYELISSDPDASYKETYTIDVTSMSPQVSCPHSTDNVKNVEDVKGVSLNQVFLGSCTNGRLEDLAIASKILKGKKVARNVRMIVVPASQKIYLDALRSGYIETLITAGAVVETSSCAACAGLHTGVLADGEVALSTTNRNFKGRMGSAKSEVYLSSPATAAASAIAGCIADPREYVD
jgi:3-isopropylmalate/(R)-2-methylmalate dehydratase large subunit